MRTCLPPDRPPVKWINQGLQDDRIRYDVVDINRAIVDALLAQPAESFRTRFGKYGRPPAPKIGIGDTVSVSIWEAAGSGLFGTSPVAGVSPGEAPSNWWTPLLSSGGSGKVSNEPGTASFYG